VYRGAFKEGEESHFVESGNVIVKGGMESNEGPRPGQVEWVNANGTNTVTARTSPRKVREVKKGTRPPSIRQRAFGRTKKHLKKGKVKGATNFTAARSLIRFTVL